MQLATLDVVVAHAGSNTAVDLRLAIGALAGLGAVTVLSPLLLVSTGLGRIVELSISEVLLADSSDASLSSQAAFLLLTGVAFGVIFEYVVIVLEQLRPIVVIIGGTVTLTDLGAVMVVATLVYVCIWRIVRDRLATFHPRVAALLGVGCVAYGFTILASISLLHTMVLGSP